MSIVQCVHLGESRVENLKKLQCLRTLRAHHSALEARDPTQLRAPFQKESYSLVSNAGALRLGSTRAREKSRSIDADLFDHEAVQPTLSTLRR